jgi:hypothetical protein
MLYSAGNDMAAALLVRNTLYRQIIGFGTAGSEIYLRAVCAKRRSDLFARRRLTPCAIRLQTNAR